MLEGLFDADRWSTTFQNMGPFWEGFGVTLQVVVAGLLLSLVLGTLLGVFSTTRSRVLRAISRVYVEFYQNTPLPVQVLFMYMAGPQFLQAITGADQPVRIAPFVLGFLGVGLYHAAYISEVIRTGIEAVPRGQMEAAQSQGFTRAQARCQPGCEKSQTKEPQERGANCPERKPTFWFHIKLPAKAAQYNKSIQVNMRIQPGHCQHGGDNFPSALLQDFGTG